MEQVSFIDLLTLQGLVAGAIEDAFPGKVWVKAEISSISVKSNGHCYLELSQSDGEAIVAKARAVIWRSRYLALAKDFREATGRNLEAGMEILSKVSISYSEVWGFLITIEEINADFTLGQSQKKRLQTIERLEQEGLMDLQKELCLPLLPYRLAVISAATAAGLGDFMRHLEQNEYGFRFSVHLLEAAMQGDAAPSSIADALSLAQMAAEPFDAVLILRGGGSELDLACFDDYSLAAAIARCTIPVFTAIGHERDYHVADMVANTFVKTPTALADLFLDCYISEDQRISAVETALRTAFISRLSAMELRLQAACSAVTVAAQGRLSNEEARLALLEVKIASADPAEVLSRGYSLVTDAAGVKMNTVSSSKPGDKINVYLGDGSLGCTVDSVLGR